MIVTVTDSQLVGETNSVLWSVIQQGPVSMAVVIKNSGINTINYRFQEFDGNVWTDMGASGTDYYNTLMSGEVKLFKVYSGRPQVRMVGNASGGALLEFSITRYAVRPSGGALPILNL